MHLADESVGFMGGYPIVGDAISLATGSALAAKLDGSDRVTAVFFGDAGMESGQLWESVNFARTHKLKLLYICENNGYATATPIDQRQPNGHLWFRLANAVGNATWEASGKPERGYHWTTQLLQELPGFLEVVTCRWREHVGPRYAWDQVPESRSQVEHHMKKDLLEGLAYPDIDARITAAFEKAETAPWPEAALAL